jgi:hypothetical protein
MLSLDLSFPWWLWLSAAAAGCVLFYTGNSRVETRLRNAGLALAAVLLAFNFVNETPVQRCRRLTKELAQDIVAQKWDAARNIMEPNTSFGVSGDGSNDGKFDREQVIAAAQSAVTHDGVKSITVTSIEAKRDQTLITVTMTVFTTQDSTLDRPVSTTWEFDWQQGGQRWKLQRLVLLMLDGQNAGQLEGILK